MLLGLVADLLVGRNTKTKCSQSYFHLRLLTEASAPYRGMAAKRQRHGVKGAERQTAQVRGPLRPIRLKTNNYPPVRLAERSAGRQSHARQPTMLAHATSGGSPSVTGRT